MSARPSSVAPPRKVDELTPSASSAMADWSLWSRSLPDEERGDAGFRRNGGDVPENRRRDVLEARQVKLQNP